MKRWYLNVEAGDSFGHTLNVREVPHDRRLLGTRIASVVSNSAPDGKLLAAAPELLEALETVMRALREHVKADAAQGGVGIDEVCPCSTDVIAPVERLIAELSG